MSENTCNVCGANLIYKDGRWVCPACGAYKEEEISNEEVTLLYNASQKLRLASFDDAEELYADIVKKYPKNSEAHWGLVLSRYGIKYEDDYDGRKLPTCYAATMESFLDDKEYLAALSCAPDAKVKAYYAEQGKIIEKNRIEWYEKASKEPAYDVFLCFKDSDKENNIERTDDSIEVANLYTYLSGKGYRVFFSRETLRDKVAEKYEPYIYNALNTASVMIVYGSKPEYFESVWMKNEWTRFLKRMREGLKVDGSLIVAYDGMNPAELPKVFAGRQCLDARKKTFYGDLETLIARVIAIAKRPKAAVERIEIKGAVGRKKTSVGTQIKTIQAGGAIGKKAPIAVNTGVATREIGQYEVPELTPDEETKTKTVFRFLSAGLFDNAQKVVEEILEKNHYNSRALFAKLLIHYEAKNETELAGKLSAVDDFEEIKTVIAYNDKSIGEKILSALAKQTMTFAKNGDFDHAISYLREIGPYNSSAVTELKANLKPYTVSLLAEHPDTSEQLFAALLETYTDADSYIPYLQEYVNECLQNNRITVAKKYNDKVVELDDGDLDATLISMYLSVSANCLADFIEKADDFADFTMLDSALRKFDADEVDGFFATMEKIISGLIGRQANGDAICRWFDFVTKYDFAGRQALIRTTMASLAGLSDRKKRSKLFDSILACIDSADVDRHIALRMEYAASMQGAGEFSLADKYYKQVLDIEEGNCDAMFRRILCHCGAKSEQELPGTVDQFEDFKSFETLLRYCPDEENRCKYLNLFLSAINERSKGMTDKATIARLAGVFDGIVKYYPEDRNKELLSYTMHFAANAKNSSDFETAEKYYAVALSIDHLCHEAYWGLLQVKLSCRNNDDLLHQKIPISDMPEFSSAIAAAGDDDRSADRYVKLAKEQRDYLKKQRDKDIRRKKIKKRVTITAALFAIALLIGGAAFVGIKYYLPERVLKYTLIENGYSVAAGKFYKSATIEIPHTVDGKPITVISAGAFKDNKTAETVIIPSSVTTIEEEAFSGCTNLKTIIFKSETQTDIFPSNDSQADENVQPESGVISIGDRAFYGCSGLTSIEVPDSVTIIGEEAFCDCTGLTSIAIPDSITSIGDYAFAVCTEIAEITIPKSVTSIGSQIFFKASSLKTVYYNSSYASPTNLFMDNGSIEKIVFGCETINANICPKSIKTVELTDAVKAVGDNAFNGCTSMTSITIPDSVTSISKSAFADTFLKNVKLAEDNANFAFENDILYVKDYSKIIYILGDAEEITLPDAMTHIPDSLFRGYKNLKKITIPDGVMSIGKYAFYDCSGLTSITIPDSVTSIGEDAFLGCVSLESITLPFVGNTLTGISNTHFGYIFGTSSPSYNDQFVPVSLKKVVITKATSIGNDAFRGCIGLTSIEIPDSVTSIGNRAFADCTGLTSIMIPNSVTNIGYGAFSGCSSLESIVLPFVGDSANKATDTYQYPFGYIFGESSYTGGVATKQYYYGSSTSSRTYDTYYIPATLKSVTITGGNILYGAFYGCKGLTSITLGNGVTSIGGSAFNGCTDLTSITIPDSVTSISGYAFYKCSGLTSITIPDSVTIIGNLAFWQCSNLTSITFKGTKAQWNAIVKNDYWNDNTGSYTIHCTDGDIKKS